MAKMKRRSIFECIYGGHCLVSYVTIVYMIEMRWTKSSKTIWVRARMARAFNLHCEMAVCASNHKWFVFSSFKRLHFVVAAAVFFLLLYIQLVYARVYYICVSLSMNNSLASKMTIEAKQHMFRARQDCEQCVLFMNILIRWVCVSACTRASYPNNSRTIKQIELDTLYKQ